MDRRLVLVRHSVSEVRPEVPPAGWGLSAAGIPRACALAMRVDPGSAERIFTSCEPKALQTALALAEIWKLPVEEIAALHEQRRPAAGLLSREQFEAQVREMFERPAEIVLGDETADAARVRFTDAVLGLVQLTARDVIVVSHGTVMALFVAARTGVDPFTFWKQQQMPCAVTLALPDLTLTGVTYAD